jgi:hypothetical protein
MDARFDEVPDVAEMTHGLAPSATAATAPLMERDTWKVELDGAIRRAARPTTVSATSLTDEGEPDVEHEPDDPGLQKRPRISIFRPG